ncbi:hypothetical protein [Oerskovia paurometabola]|uniref:TetR family transcriptional regulator n=1 Tax=Oerskovia paurometabola TaxID=162170 RepID=A0ABW1XGA6_9CELL|nr:hypothetical protein [Oerskovia paurometabola]MBM7497339.1 hypothetical protein [Oerskovia paurometabola]
MTTPRETTLLGRVEDAARQHLDWAKTNGRAPSVLAVARAVGLSNTTFRRNFPEVVVEITAARSGAVTQTGRKLLKSAGVRRPDWPERTTAAYQS